MHLVKKMRGKAGCRGQALLVALLILFVLVLVSALFVRLLARSAWSTARQSDITIADQMAQAAVQYADQMLTTSPLGADWRPPPPPLPEDGDLNGDGFNDFEQYFDAYERDYGFTDFSKYPDPLSEAAPGKVPGRMPAFGPGYFLLKVEYAPHGNYDSGGNPINDPLSKFIRITAIGRSRNNLAVFRQLVAYKPIVINEYVRFVTNKKQARVTEDVGIAPWIDYDADENNDEQYMDPETGNPSPQSIYDISDHTAISTFHGPIRAQGDVFFRGATRFMLTPVPPLPPSGLPKYRNDKIEVTRDVSFSTVDKNMGTIVELALSDAPDPLDPADWIRVYDKDNPTWPSDSQLMDAEGDVVFRRGVRPVKPPEIFTLDPGSRLARYEALTKYSGEWSPGAGYNTGEYGYGRGIYINNSADIQFNHDLDELRDNWLRPLVGGSLGPNWQGTTTNPYYIPPGVVIELNPGAIDPATGQYPTYPNPGAPYITFVRSDGQNFRNPDGTDSGSTTLQLPYPENGVIYCEGNARVYGALPMSGLPDDYSLTIVSGGTIYIEGSLTTPQDADPTLEMQYRSYLALLAKDYVTLNPTLAVRFSNPALFYINGDVSLEPNSSGSVETHWEIRPGGSLTAQFVNSPLGLAPAGSIPALTLQHTGEDPGPTIINVIVNDQYFDFDLTEGVDYSYTFYSPPPTAASDDYTCTNTLSPNFETRSWQDTTGVFNTGPGEINTITLQLDPSSSTSYWLADFRIGVEPVEPSLFLDDYSIPSWRQGVHAQDVLVHALVYAENGSWFVIPGKYFNEDATHERAELERRYNARIIFRGAISENHAADSPAVAEWIRKWSYPYYRTAYNGYPADNVARWGSIEYHYDDDLLNNYRPFCDTDPSTGQPRERGRLCPLPALPVSPDIIYETRG